MCFRPAAVDLNGPIKCPKCGAEVDPSLDACPSCGAKATKAPGMPGAPGAPGMPAIGGALGSVAPHWSQFSLLKSLVAPQAGHVLSMLMAAGLKHM